MIQAWQRFWALSWWKGPILGVVGFLAVTTVLACDGNGDSEPPEGFSMHFIDVGQGDAILIETDSGETLLVDGGPNKDRISDRLSLLAVDDLDAILLTHADTDHFSGLVAVLENYDIERIYLSDRSDGTKFSNFMTDAEAEGADISQIGRGDIIELGALDIQVLHPGELAVNKNADSIVLLVQCGTVGVLLVGDADVSSEESMNTAGVLTDIDVLKVGHHGSDTATSTDFLDVVRPEYAVISAGLNRQYGHPHQETLNALDAANVEVFLTDTTEDADGITLTTDCNDVTLEPTQSATPQPTPEPAEAPTVVPTPTQAPEPTPAPTQAPQPTQPPAPEPTEPPPEPTPPPEPIEEPPPANCDPSYPDFCIPPPPPDLNCPDIPQKNFTVLQPDPHGFDGNKNGVGCES